MAIRPNYYSDFTTFENVDYKLQNLIEDSGLFQGYILTNYALVLAYPRGSTDFKSSGRYFPPYFSDPFILHVLYFLDT